MEFQQHAHGFFEEMLDSNIGFGFIDDIDEQFDQNALLATPTTVSVVESSPLSITSQTSSSVQDFSFPYIFDPQTLDCSSFGQHFINPLVDHDLDHHIKIEDSTPLYDQDFYSMFSMLDQVQNSSHFVSDRVNMDPHPHPHPLGVTGDVGFNMGKSKVEGQPSKNLMAERRRRKRLNDRLSMLRSVVPKISKMDRTSILADTIDYMKELIEKIKHMQMQMDMDMDISSSNQLTAKPKELYIRNSPKIEVERRDGGDTRVSVWCGGGKPELLISTVSTLEALGLQIHQCLITCFNDFIMHASCSQDVEILTSEDIKQALYRNAGYPGTCL